MNQAIHEVLVFLYRHFDKMLWSFFAVFFTAVSLYLDNHAVTDNRVLTACLAGISGSIAALAILTSTKQNERRGADSEGSGKGISNGAKQES
jgi:hypothetical protein